MSASECRFQKVVIEAIPMPGRKVMAVLPKACRNPCASGATATLREGNLGAGPEISESSPGPTGSECRFGIEASRAVPITGRGNIHVLPKWCENRCTSTHAPRWHFRPRDRNFTRLASSRPARRDDSEEWLHKRF
ncbi:hypothetical protein Taro_052060 [Colocasia esculenta]|uniref:Uncharacterized protein n=1 Tax=Colocasia esculenta TaxID=4460 RepID=A0A843XIQ4_COLES|nr:hypothetical protein [Colocasia esculenta]